MLSQWLRRPLLLFILGLCVDAQNSTYDVLQYVDQFIGTSNGGRPFERPPPLCKYLILRVQAMSSQELLSLMVGLFFIFDDICLSVRFYTTCNLIST